MKFGSAGFVLASGNLLYSSEGRCNDATCGASAQGSGICCCR